MEKREKETRDMGLCVFEKFDNNFQAHKPKGMIGWGGTKTLPGTSCDLLGVEKVKRKTKPKKNENKNKNNLVITVATIIIIIIKWKRLKQYAVKSWIFRSLEMLILVKKIY